MEPKAEDYAGAAVASYMITVVCGMVGAVLYGVAPWILYVTWTIGTAFLVYGVSLDIRGRRARQ